MEMRAYDFTPAVPGSAAITMSPSARSKCHIGLAISEILLRITCVVSLSLYPVILATAVTQSLYLCVLTQFSDWISCFYYKYFNRETLYSYVIVVTSVK